MHLLTWNIQCGKGCDGVTDLKRIVKVAREMADADIFCFQEVSRAFASFADGTDQAAEIAALLPGYFPVFRPAVETVDWDGQIRQFGNMTLSRLPVLQIANHLLPWPGAGTVRSMRRHALEVTVRTAFGPLRTVNVHLEYYSAEQREKQVQRLLELQEEASSSPRTATGPHIEPYESQTLAGSGMLCGDFNFDASDRQHELIDKSSRAGLCYRDSWTVGVPERARAPTFGVYDTTWVKKPDCRDFIFVSEDLCDRVHRTEVNTETDASDHQPMLIELAD